MENANGRHGPHESTELSLMFRRTSMTDNTKSQYVRYSSYTLLSILTKSIYDLNFNLTNYFLNY